MKLQECIRVLEKMVQYDWAYIDEIPEILREDFKEFIIGHTLTSLQGREITFDLKTYYKKIMTQGTSKLIKWEL